MSKDPRENNNEQEFDKAKFIKRIKITIVISIVALLIGAATVVKQVKDGESPAVSGVITGVLAVNLAMNLKALRNAKNYHRNPVIPGRYFKMKHKKLRKTKMHKASETNVDAAKVETSVEEVKVIEAE